MNEPEASIHADIKTVLTQEVRSTEIMDDEELFYPEPLEEFEEGTIKEVTTSDTDMRRSTVNYLRGEFGNHTLEQLKEMLDFFKQISITPLFDTEGLAEMSKTYFFYFEIYLYLLKLLIFFIIVGNIEVISMIYVLENYFTDTSEDYWILGWGPLHVFNAIIFWLIYRSSENRILKDPKLSNLAWTEEQFSVMIDNIPHGTFEHELQECLEDILERNGEASGVRYIILLQECHSYNKLKSMLKKVDSKLLKNRFKSNEKKLKYYAKKQELEKRMSQYEQRAMNKEFFINKAIVVFNKVNSRFIIHDKLNEISKNLNASERSRMYTNSVFKNCNLQASFVTEPRDILFERMHYENRQILYRTILSYAIIAFMMIIGLTVMYYIRVRQFCIMALTNPDMADNDLPCNQLLFLEGPDWWMEFQKFSGGIVNVTIAWVMENRYKTLSKYSIHKTHTSAETSFIYYMIITNFFNFVVLIIMPLFILGLKWMQNVIFEISIILLIQRLIFKTYRIEWKKKKKRDLIESNPDSHLYNEDEVYTAYQINSFKFLESTGDLMGLIYMCSGFFLYDSIDMVPCVFFGVICYLVYDKYLILKCTMPFSLRTMEFGLMILKPFFYEGAIYMFVVSIGMIKVFIFSGDTYDGISSSKSLLGSIIFATGALVYALTVKKDYKKIVREKFEKTQKQVQYEDVSMVFETTYLQQYPYGGLISF